MFQLKGSTRQLGDIITVEGGQGQNKNYMPGYLQDAVTKLTRDLVAQSLY